MDVCKGCAFEFGWTQQSTSVPNECKGCEMVDGKPSNYKPKPQTNADRIRTMSDEELAEWMAECNAYKENADASQWLPWLKQPAE